MNEKNEIICLDSLILILDENKYCCICFSTTHCVQNKIERQDLSLADIEKDFFKNDIIPNDILVKSCCGEHYICINCIRKIINNYENHPINETNSHFACPYPFKECVTEIGFKNVFDHNLIRKICCSEQEWINYITQADRFSFPGYTIIKCPISIYRQGYRGLCNTNILLENEVIKTTPIGELIVNCDQNANCLKRFCFNCKQQINYYQDTCNECKTIHENENPNVFNYFFNKNCNEILADVNVSVLDYEESSYLYLNKDITEEIAVDQIVSVINDVNSYMICCICKISLYKTERCNGLSHHNLERCYACGRIGFLTRGLGSHWNVNGVGGCFRFDHDSYVRTHIPEYICNDTFCYNHDRGDCILQEHQQGILKLEILRKRAYVYHMIKSLLPEIRLSVYDKLYEKLCLKPDLLEFLPYKQTFILLMTYKNHNRDFIEEIVYTELGCQHPQLFFISKNYWIPSEEYINSYQNKQNYKDTFNIITRYIENDENEDTDNISIDSNSGLIHHIQQEIDIVDTDLTFSQEIDIVDTDLRFSQEINIVDRDTSIFLDEILNELTQNIYETQNPTFDTQNTIVTIYESTPQNENINRYDLPAITLNSYSLLINVDTDTDTDTDTDIDAN
jgi:hypothetical protein